MRSPKLEQWLEDSVIQEALMPTLERSYVDLDPTFNMHVDEDFDHRMSGVSRSSFCNTYLEWVQYCASRRDKVNSSKFYVHRQGCDCAANWLILANSGPIFVISEISVNQVRKCFPVWGVGVFTTLEQSYKCYDCGMVLRILANFASANLIPDRQELSLRQKDHKSLRP